jgi:hypothetical protein
MLNGLGMAGVPQQLQWRHLNVFNKECMIVCALPRGRRGDNDKIYRVTPP